MKSPLLQSAFACLLLLQLVQAQTAVRFFYSRKLDACEWGSTNTFPAGDNTKNGGLCAYTTTARLYSCPAPDPTCWTFSQTCKGGTSTPGSDQFLCTASGASWCCAEGETCTVTQNQINICISNFTNPNAGLSSEEASAKEFSAIPLASIGTTIPSGTPTPFSTRQLRTSSTSGTSTPTSAGSATTSTSKTSDSAAAGAQNDASSSKSGLSGAAIAGIVVGVIACVAIVTAAAVFLIIHKRKTAGAGQMPVHEKPADYYGQQGVQTPGYGAPPHYGGEVYQKVAPEQPQEMPARQPAQEMP